MSRIDEIKASAKDPTVRVYQRHEILVMLAEIDRLKLSWLGEAGRADTARDDLHDAKDRLTALEADNERMKEALKPSDAIRKAGVE